MNDFAQHPKLIQLQGKKVLVMGLGVHGGGLGVARYLQQQGAQVTVTDLRDSGALQNSLEALAGLPIRFVLGEHRDEDFAEAELVIKNPGVPASSRFLQIARDHGAAIETEMTLFFRLCPGPILGVTGTKGKTTTTTLAGAMLREQFSDTVVAGNMRVSALEQLPKIGPNTPVVLELSSFALENLGEAGLSPRYACVTNLSPDHLDRYPTMEDYGEAKRQIFLYQGEDDVLVLNANDPITSGWANDAPGRVVWSERVKGRAQGSVVNSQELGEKGGRGEGETNVKSHTPHPAPHTPSSPQASPTDSGQRASEILEYGESGLFWHNRHGEREHICTLGSIKLPGAHNLANVAAAAALAKAFGVSNENIRRALASFTGVEHRLEPVRELDGVRYVNDTAATVPEAAIAALRSFDAPIILICGGADKRLEFTAFAREIHLRAKAVVLLNGTATPHLQAELVKTTDGRRPTTEESSAVVSRQLPIVGPFDDFAAAIRAARGLAEAGDVVLLSPGCASFGMFRNEFHRGEEFRRIVKELI